MLKPENQIDKQRFEESKQAQTQSGENHDQAVLHAAREVKQQRTEEGRSKVAHGDEAQEHAEGSVARTIEQQTAKLPSDLFLWAAGESVLGSLYLQAQGKKHESLFVGQWVSPFLILGLYNKVVKVAGSDQVS